MNTTTSEDPTIDVSFSTRIREASTEAHREAEHAPFLRDLFGGAMERERFVELVAQQWYVYDVLEAAAEAMAHDEIGSRFVFPELTRQPSLRGDLAFLLDASWEGQIPPSAPTRAYCDRLREVGFDAPGRFVAHHYVRYMGDLSGGPMIARAAKRALDLQDDGLRFYEFTEIADAAAFKDDYRRRLDVAPWSADDQAAIIDEVLLGYRFNTDLIAAIA